MSDTALYERIVELLRQGRSFAVVHLVHRKGATPNDPGSKMLVFPDGTTEFTIGGGPFEAEVVREAVQALATGRSLWKEYELMYETLGMRCGGRATVYIEIVQPLIPLWIFGAGHCGQALTRLALDSGFFQVTLIDDRPDWLEKAPTHPRLTTILTDARYRKGVPEPPAGAYVVIVTRCHDIDEQVLARMIEQEGLHYLGMIGSRAKVRALRDQLRAQGVSAAALAALDAPIGVPTGGKAPMEIAVSIMARLLQVKNGLHPRFSDQIRTASTPAASKS